MARQGKRELMRQPMATLRQEYQIAYGQDVPDDQNESKAFIVNALARKGVTINRRGRRNSGSGNVVMLSSDQPRKRTMSAIRKLTRSTLSDAYNDVPGRYARIVRYDDSELTVVIDDGSGGDCLFTVISGDDEQSTPDYLEAAHIIIAAFELN